MFTHRLDESKKVIVVALNVVLVAVSGMTIITTTLLLTCLPLLEAGVEGVTGEATHTLPTTTRTRTTTTTTAMTITTTVAATTTRTTGTMTSRPRHGGEAAAEARVAGRPQPEGEAAPGHPEGGPASPSAADRDHLAAGAAPEEEEEEPSCSREDEEGYVVLGVAAVEM